MTPEATALAHRPGHRWRESTARFRLLYLHGLGAHSGWAAPLGRALAGMGFDVVAPDLPGHGGHEDCRVGSPKDLISAAMDALSEWSDAGERAPLWIAGTSLGGTLAVRVARRCEKIGAPPVGGVILLAPAFVPNYLRGLEIVSMVGRLLLGGGGRYRTPIARGLEIVWNPDLQKELAADRLGRATFTAGDHVRAQLTILRAFGDLRRLRVPVLCLQGDEDAVVDADWNRRLFDGREQREYVSVAGGHHDLQAEPQIGRIDERIAGWVAVRAERAPDPGRSGPRPRSR